MKEFWERDATRSAPEWPSYEVALPKRCLELLEPRECDLILELDRRLWGGERDEPARFNRDRQPDPWLDDYTEDADA